MAKKTWARAFFFICLLLFVAGLLFIGAPNMTGNTIGGLDKSGSSIFGIVLLVLGIAGYYFASKFLGSYL